MNENQQNKTNKHRKLNNNTNKTRKCKQEFTFHSFEDKYAEMQKKKLKTNVKKTKKKVEGRIGTSRKDDIFTPGKEIQAELIELFRKPFSPTTVTPRSDFYTYINYIWLMDTKKKAFIAPKDQRYYVQIDDFRVTQDKVYRELIVIIEDHIKNNHDKQAQMIKNVYTSLLNLNPQSTRKHISKVPEDCREFVKKDDLWRYMAHINHNEMVRWACPIRWQVMSDDKNAKVFRNHISLPELSLYDAELYLDDNTGKTAEFVKYRKEVQSKYVIYVDDIFKSCLGKKHGLSGKDVFEVEK